MKKLCILFCLLFLGLSGCGSSGEEPSGESSSGIVALELESEAEGRISTKGEIDWYEYTAVEAGRTLKVYFQESDVTDSFMAFSITAYDVLDDGTLRPIIGWVASEDSVVMDDIVLNIPIEGRRRIRFAVREYMDDDFSDRLPYKLEIMYEGLADSRDNSTFVNATEVGVGTDADLCAADSIDEVGMLNVHTFTITDAGVYRVSAAYDGTPSVNLGMQLFDAEGNRLHQFSGARPNDSYYFFLTYLEAGQYYLSTYDQGRDDVDGGMGYHVCVAPVDAPEANANDSMDNPETLDVPVGDTGYLLDAALSYMEDEDWYLINIPDDTDTSSYNLRIELEPTDNAVLDALDSQHLKCRVRVLDAAGTVLYDYETAVGATATPVEIGRGQGNAHYVVVTPIFDHLMEEIPYQAVLKVLEVSDPNEQEGCITLSTGVEYTGKIIKVGDTDQYCITPGIDTGAKILEVYFETDEGGSEVDYVVSVDYGQTHQVLRDKYKNATTRGEDALELRSSYFLNSDNINEDGTVMLTVKDDQNNSGDNCEYHLRVNVVSVQTALPAGIDLSGVGGDTPEFFSETEEFAIADNSVTIVEYNSVNNPEFNVNTSDLVVDAGLVDGGSWTSPWLAGYVDYDGDRDLFELNLDNLINTLAEDASYYFDIQVQFYAPASSIDFFWALFRDGDHDGADGPNGQLLERTLFVNEELGASYEYDYLETRQYRENSEGIIAAWADMDFDNAVNGGVVNSTVPEPGTDQQFWIGDGWRGSKFYFSIQDFNRIGLDTEWDPDGGENNEGAMVQIPNPELDNDWGYPPPNGTGAPYFFQVSVTYHAGASYPATE